MSSSDLKEEQSSSQCVVAEISGSPNSSLGNLDDHYKIYESLRDVEIDPGDAKRVLRKLEWRILFLLMIKYILQYLGKISINLSSAYGLPKSLHLTDSSTHG